MRSSPTSSRSIFRGLALRFRAFKYSAKRVLLPQMPATVTMLEKLPVEILELIASDLMICDIINLRSTCHKIYAKTNDYCGRILFHTISTDLSLRELHWLSNSFVKNQQLANAIKVLCVEPKHGNHGLGYDYYWNRRGHDGHLILPCDGFEALRTLLDHLPTCYTIQVYAKDMPGDNDAPDDRLHTTDAVQLLLLLAAESDLRTSMLDIGSPEAGIHLDAARLPIETLSDPNVISMLANLIGFSMRLVYSDDIIASGWLSVVFSAFKRLKDLAFDLDMSWGEVEVTKPLIDSLKCTGLENLRLSRFKTSLYTLDAFTARSCNTLAALRLYAITIVGTSEEGSPWKSWLSSLHDNLPKLTSIDIDQLSTVQPAHGKSHLHFPSLMPLIEQAGHVFKRSDGRTFKCFLPQIDGNDAPRMRFEITSHGWEHRSQLMLSGVRYRGTEMAKALEFLQGHAEEMSIV
jgi:hypothetical protein